MRLNPFHGDVYSIQHYVIKFVTGQLLSLGTPVSSTNKTEILLNVAINTLNQTFSYNLDSLYITIQPHGIQTYGLTQLKFCACPKHWPRCFSAPTIWWWWNDDVRWQTHLVIINGNLNGVRYHNEILLFYSFKESNSIWHHI